MSVITLLDVKVLNNPASFGDPYQFEITFECLENLQKDLEWKLTYVGSAKSAEHDQELDSLLVGPIPPGVNKFVFEADPPSTTNIPSSEILGVTVILLTCAYDGREFVRIGYYVNNEYTDESLIENPPVKPIMEKIRRSILAEKPRVTRFAIKWDSEASAPPEFPPEQPEADIAADDEAEYGAEEADVDAAEELEEEEKVEVEDAEMEGVEKDDASEAGSEDLGEDSEEDEEEEEEEELAEAEHDGDVEMGDDSHADATAHDHSKQDVMVH